MFTVVLAGEKAVGEALKHAESARVMAAGRLVMEGSAAEVAAHPGIAESYVGA